MAHQIVNLEKLGEAQEAADAAVKAAQIAAEKVAAALAIAQPPGAAQAKEPLTFKVTALYPARTGLPMTVWAGPRGKARHAPRIKVNLAHANRMDVANTAVVGLLPIPYLIAGNLSAQDQAAVFAWASHNTSVILDHWNGTIDGDEMAQRTQRVP